MNSRKLWLVVGGVALATIAIGLPTAWYATLPFRTDLPTPPIRGVTLLRIALAVEASLLLLVAAAGWRYQRRADAIDAPDTSDDALDERTARRLLWLITALALGLRLYRVTSDLWLDEISALVGFGRSPVLHILTVFSRSGNHLMNTLLVKGLVALFGEREWVARLPAVLFGVATVPALYWTARFVLTRAASLVAALLLAVSYHHIFFSQNARGYTAYMFFSVVSTGVFIRALETDRLRTWTVYVATAVLNMTSLVLSAFVLAGHFVTGVATAADAARRGRAATPYLIRLVTVFVIIGLAGLTVYSVVLPQAFAGFTAPYKTATSGFSPVSREFVMDIVRGVSQGFGPLLLVGALPFAAIAALGFGGLAVRARWQLAAALALPPALTLVVFVARHMTLRPRFFLMAVPLAMVCVAQGIWILAEFVGRRGGRSSLARGIRAALVTGLVAASLLSLVNYYRTPKQDYRGTIAFLERARRPGDPVIVYGNAELGFRFYVPRSGVDRAADYVYVRESARVDSVRAANPGRPTYLVFTLARDIRLTDPAFAEELQRKWERLRVFPGTVGDGAITVLRRE